ncbi:MAG: flagellar biosynthesis protein FlhF [Gammaproteobacteria bacterium]|nr:flagellar biosynthesis protein FlhF [Gammaproteobacteria bacterium]
MKLKRYTAPDIRRAMAKVREELGPDAVILSNRKTHDGVEIIAATDYDDAIVNSSVKATEPAAASKPVHEKLAPENTRKLAEHLSNKLDIPTNSSSLLKKTIESTYGNSSSAEEIEQLATERRTKSRADTQVSSEWISQLNASKSEEASSDSSVHAENPPDDMKNVWEELNNLRGLLETQLSSLAWTNAEKRHPQKTKLLKHLLELGLTPELSYKLAGAINEKDNFETSWRKSLATLASQLPVVEEDIIKDGGIFALVGPTGVGKTTTIAKMAARYALTHGTDSIALVTTDNYRIGAQEQLRTYGRILGTPVKVANDAEELRKILKSLYDKDLVLIDTAGMSQRDLRLTEQFAMLSEGSSLIKSFLVLSASSQQKVLEETVQGYKKVMLDGCIITKVDESITLGGAISTLVKNQLPLTYFSDGQRVPEDLHKARNIDFLKKAVAMMNRARVQLDEEVIELTCGGLIANDLS